MSDELISIKQYADLQGITTAAVYKQLKTSLKPYIKQFKTNADGKKPIIKLNLTAMRKDGLIEVENQVLNQEPEVLNQVENQVDRTERYINSLEKQIEMLTEQLNRKDGQIEHLQKMLDQQQQLSGHAQVMLEDKKPAAKKSIFDRIFRSTPTATNSYYTDDVPGQAEPENTEKSQ